MSSAVRERVVWHASALLAGGVAAGSGAGYAVTRVPCDCGEGFVVACARSCAANQRAWSRESIVLDMKEMGERDHLVATIARFLPRTLYVYRSTLLALYITR